MRKVQLNASLYPISQFRLEIFTVMKIKSLSSGFWLLVVMQ